MSTPYVPGPSYWYLSSAPNGAYEFLGMCESLTRLSLSPQWDEVYVDGAGSRVPYDLEFQGAEASVSGDLIRYNEAVLNRAKNWLNNPGAIPGTIANDSIGTLARTEGRAFSLAIVSRYRTKAVFTGQGMNGAFLFPFAVPAGSWDVGQGTKVKKERILFRCLPTFNLYGGGTLYSNDISGISLPTPS